MSKTPISIFLALTLGASGASQAAPVIDQNAPGPTTPVWPSCRRPISRNRWQAVRFEHRAGPVLYLAGRGEVTYLLFDNLNGNLLTSATGTVSSAPAGLTCFGLRFPSLLTRPITWS